LQIISGYGHFVLNRLRVVDALLPASPCLTNRNTIKHHKSTFLSQIRFPSKQHFKTKSRRAHITSSLRGGNNINISSCFTHVAILFPKARNNITRVAVYYQTIESRFHLTIFLKTRRTSDTMEVKHRDRNEEIITCLRVNV